ncbi:MAG: rod shape-determining protein RodA [Gemmatimonadetes bacterium]|nr:rod shape-determining protein RodA [Gemmatimonadota bacterium]
MSAARRRIADPTLVALAIALSVFGIAMVYSAGQTDAPTAVAKLYRNQLGWFVLGLGAAYAVSRASVRFLDWVTTPAYAVSCVLLFALLFIGAGAGTAASSKSWLAIGGVRLGQPSELAKIAVVLMLARILAARREAPRSLIDLWQPALAVFVPWVLIMRQPDLGTGIVFVGIFFAMLFWAGASWKLLVLVASPVVSLILAFSTGLWGAWFLVLIALVLWYKPYLVEGVAVVLANVVTGVVAPVLWDKLNPYQQKRLLVFLDPSSDPQASGYHVIQSQVAIGSGGWLGKGFTLGSQKRLAFLPAQHTDFIFPVVGEELGFLGVTIALALFLFLLLRSVRIAARSPDPFPSLVAFGLASAWFVHILVNVGMTLNLMPITGIPLPFFSYGGSFMLMCWLAVGILGRISSEGRGPADMLVI